jgi:hypothetical protein
MSEAFIKKNVKLSLEFDEYLAKHPAMFESIPNGAYIVITISGDNKFNADSISIVKNMRKKRIVEAHKAANKWSLKPLELQAA